MKYGLGLHMVFASDCIVTKEAVKLYITPSLVMYN